jgi:arylsulfatase A-like enzyme
MGLCGSLLLFISEWILTSFYAEVHNRTYAFFLGLFAISGILGGVILAILLRLTARFLKDKFVFASKDSFVPSVFLFAIFFAYGFFYINETLAPGYGLFSPLSLIADLVYFVLCLAIFRLANVSKISERESVISFIKTSFLPITLLVAVNVRFFAWQPPLTQMDELFFGIFCLGMAGIVGIFLNFLICGLLLKSRAPFAQVVCIVGVGVLCLITFGLTGAPSTNSFQVSDSTAATGSQLEKTPNIIWIVMDSARRDHISIYGSAQNTTPNIDQFSKDARIFNRAISTSPWTWPSHASMFTGMFPSKHQAHFFGDSMFSNPLSRENVTIAEILSEHGYETGAIIANNSGVSRFTGCDQGFHYYFDARPLVYSLFWGRFLLSLPKSFRRNTLSVNKVCLATEMDPIVNSWLHRHSANQPFFLFINYMEPHAGVEVLPEPYNSMFGFDPDEHNKVFEDLDMKKVVYFDQQVTPEQMKLRNIYIYRKLFMMDVYLGKLFRKLKSMDLYDDSFIIITSDHGDLFGEHNSFGHNTDLYNELLHIPMIIKYPNSSRKGHFDKVVQTIDVMPELLTYLGIEIPAEVQGQPFDQVNHPIIAELFKQQYYYLTMENPERYYRDLKAIYTKVGADSLKYIEASNGDSELFDLANDHAEENNLISERTHLAAVLQEQLDEWRVSFVPVNGTDEIDKTKVNEMRERLRSLGYIK